MRAYARERKPPARPWSKQDQGRAIKSPPFCSASHVPRPLKSGIAGDRYFGRADMNAIVKPSTHPLAGQTLTGAEVVVRVLADEGVGVVRKQEVADDDPQRAAPEWQPRSRLESTQDHCSWEMPSHLPWLV